MKFTHFFIERPIFAGVLSVLLLVAGSIAVLQLPIAEYPEVSPPTIVVTAQYPRTASSLLDQRPPPTVETSQLPWVGPAGSDQNPVWSKP